MDWANRMVRDKPHREKLIKQMEEYNKDCEPYYEYTPSTETIREALEGKGVIVKIYEIICRGDEVKDAEMFVIFCDNGKYDYIYTVREELLNFLWGVSDKYFKGLGYAKWDMSDMISCLNLKFTAEFIEYINDKEPDFYGLDFNFSIYGIFSQCVIDRMSQNIPYRKY